MSGAQENEMEHSAAKKADQQENKIEQSAAKAERGGVHNHAGVRVFRLGRHSVL